MKKSHAKVRRRQVSRPVTYSHLDVMMASPTAPMPEAKRLHQLSRMWQGLRALEVDAVPSADDWRVVSDAVNLLEALVGMGEVEDGSGLLHDAVRELDIAGARHVDEGRPIRLDGPGIPIIRAVLEDYAEALEALPQRTMVQAHRIAERRIAEILAGKSRPHDVKVVTV